MFSGGDDETDARLVEPPRGDGVPRGTQESVGSRFGEGGGSSPMELSASVQGGLFVENFGNQWVNESKVTRATLHDDTTFDRFLEGHFDGAVGPFGLQNSLQRDDVDLSSEDGCSGQDFTSPRGK